MSRYCKSKLIKGYRAICILLVTQGTFEINLGPDRLAGPKALNPNHCRQPTLRLHDLCLEVLTVYGT